MQVNIPEVKVGRVTKNANVDVPTLFITIIHFSGELAKIHSDLPSIKGHGHKYTIMSEAVYKKLKKVKATVKDPVHPGKSKVKDITKTGRYQKELTEYHLYEQVNRIAIEYLDDSFEDTGVLFDLYDNDGVINDTLYNIIQHLYSVILDYKKQREINKIKQVLDVKWDASESVQKYLKILQNATYELDTLMADPGTSKK